MRKALLGTTALVAAGVLGAPGAQAAFDVQVHGNYTAAYAFVDEDDKNGEAGNARQNQALNQDVEVHFRFMQTFDNGIAVGGRVELEGATQNSPTNTLSGSGTRLDQIDEKWAYIRGGWGELRFGDEDDARKLMATFAPEASSIFFVNDPYWTFANALVVPGPAGQVSNTNSTMAWIENDSTKILYFTPVFNGFQFAVSYAPDGTQDRAQAGTGGTNEFAPVMQVSNAISAGGIYNGKFGESTTVQVALGYTTAQAETPAGTDPEAWHAGLVLGFGAIKVGGSIGLADDINPGGNWNGANATEATVFDLGVTYTFGAAAIGVNWSHGEYEQKHLDNKDDSLDQMQVSAGYQLGEGVRLGAFIARFDYDDGGAVDNDNTGWQTGVGVNIGF
jgi:predicted porin